MKAVRMPNTPPALVVLVLSRRAPEGGLGLTHANRKALTRHTDGKQKEREREKCKKADKCKMGAYCRDPGQGSVSVRKQEWVTIGVRTGIKMSQ